MFKEFIFQGLMTKNNRGGIIEENKEEFDRQKQIINSIDLKELTSESANEALRAMIRLWQLIDRRKCG